jgi:uncharacterized protein
MPFRKIINDPVYGFITINDVLIYQIIAHPYYQRLRRINQMALASLVYPGAVHTRMHHSLGAYHLMHMALQSLKTKGVKITAKEEQAAKIAILLHDVGHGPFSHALEGVLITGAHHEEISIAIFKELNTIFKGKLTLALAIFKNEYPKRFLHQLISGQLDVDRMDYLTRDSFFTGVIEGAIGYDRIINMLVVHNDALMVEEKGIYSIEKFLVARRLMYWQVYLHKTVLCAEKVLKQIIHRAKFIKAPTTSRINDFLTKHRSEITVANFCSIDDVDVMVAIKEWSSSNDKVLRLLCDSILNRNLFKTTYQLKPIAEKTYKEQLKKISTTLKISLADAKWLILKGESTSSTYNFTNEHIYILFKNNKVKDISDIENALINENITGKIKKHYFCYPRL